MTRTEKPRLELQFIDPVRPEGDTLPRVMKLNAALQREILTNAEYHPFASVIDVVFPDSVSVDAISSFRHSNGRSYCVVRGMRVHVGSIPANEFNATCVQSPALDVAVTELSSIHRQCIRDYVRRRGCDPTCLMGLWPVHTSS